MPELPVLRRNDAGMSVLTVWAPQILYPTP